MVELRDSKPLDYIRYVFSFLLLTFSIIVTSYAIFEGETGFWKVVPGPAAFVLFVFDLILLGIVEGLQISLVELKRQHPDSYKNSHKRAYKLGQIANKQDNVERFLMGRQVFVVFLVFFIAKLTTVQLDNLETDFLFPVPQWLYSSLFETGFLTCVLVVIIAQLMPQIVAAKFPVHFLNIKIMYVAYYMCVFVEATGLTHACWVLSHLMGKLAGMTNEDALFQSKANLLRTNYNGPANQKNNKFDTVIEKPQNNIQPEITLGEVEDLLDKTKSTAQNSEIVDKLRFLVKTLDAEVDENKQAILRYYLDSHPERFRNFPSIIGNKVYPPPQEVADQFESLGQEVPGFLRDISDPHHIPPHIVCCELLAHVVELQKKVDLLEGAEDQTHASLTNSVSV